MVAKKKPAKSAKKRANRHADGRFKPAAMTQPLTLARPSNGGVERAFAVDGTAGDMYAAAARNCAVDIVIRNQCTCEVRKKRHSDDCELSANRRMPLGKNVLVEMALYHMKPQHGDIVLLAIKTEVPSRQLAAFRTGLYEFSKKHYEETGAKIQFLVVNTDVDVHHLSKDRVKEVLHDNKVVPHEDGSLIETMRAIGDDG